MIRGRPEEGGVPEILVDGGLIDVGGTTYKAEGASLIAAVLGITNSDSKAPDAPESLSWCPPYDYTPIDGFNAAAVEQIKQNAGAQLEPTAAPTAEPTADSTAEHKPMVRVRAYP